MNDKGVIEILDSDEETEETNNGIVMPIAHRTVIPRKQLPTKTPAKAPPSSGQAATAVATASVPPISKNAIALENITEGKRKRQRTKRYDEEFGLSGNSSDSTSTDYEEKVAYKPRSYPSSSPSPPTDIIGKELVRQWIDLQGKCRCLYGKVIQAEPHAPGEVGKVHVEYSSASMDSLKKSFPQWCLPKIEHIDKTLAWGCVQTFNQRHGKVSEPVPGHEHVWRWIVPDYVEEIREYPPKKTLQFGDFEICLEARKSEIPLAGLGVFLQATPLREIKPEVLVLQAGVSYDLGVYTPLRDEDLRTKCEGSVKSFLFDGESESWAFGVYEDTHPLESNDQRSGEEASNHRRDSIYDITDNTTGKLHEIAKKSTLTYVNETDGKQKTTIFAYRDPCRHVHYLLGGEHESLSIPCNEWIEVKIDYGENYEPVRKCRGYSRTQMNTKENIRASRDKEKNSTLVDIKHKWDCKDIKSALNFLLYLSWNEMDDLPKHRALLLLLACSLRMVRGLEASPEINHLQERGWGLITCVLRVTATEDVKKSFRGDDSKWMDDFLKYHSREKIPHPPETLRKLLSQLSKYGFADE